MDTRLRVMVVDDHPMWRDAVARDLDAEGFDVVAVAASGDEALTRFTASAPEVLVLDLQISAPDGVEVTWLHREGAVPGTTTLLADGLRAVPWREGRVHVFAHGEREAMKSLRDYLFGERELERSQVSLSGYWAYGRTEDRFQAEKREPIGQILPA